MKSLAFESKPFQSHSRGEIPSQARRKEWLRCLKLKQAFVTDSELNFSCTKFNVLGLAREKFGVGNGP